jgi:hypothetical protein
MREKEKNGKRSKERNTGIINFRYQKKMKPSLPINLLIPS